MFTLADSPELLGLKRISRDSRLVPSPSKKSPGQLPQDSAFGIGSLKDTSETVNQIKIK